jgi:hypothetical protein
MWWGGVTTPPHPQTTLKCISPHIKRYCDTILVKVDQRLLYGILLKEVAPEGISGSRYDKNTPYYGAKHILKKPSSELPKA